MLAFVRRLLGRETVSDVAALFTDQLRAIKLILCKWFAAEFGKLPSLEAKDPVVIAGQVVNYLSGEDLNVVPEQTNEQARAMIVALRPEIPETAANLMRQDRNLREIIVQTLRIRLILNLHYRTTDATAAGLKERLTDLLLMYGHEFPDEPIPRRYNALLATLITWADSPQFPGRGE